MNSGNHVDRAGLRPSITLFFDESHLGADTEALESPSEHAVAMKVNRAPLRGIDAPVVLFGMQLGNHAVWLTGMCLHLAVTLTLVILELAPGGTEGVSQSHEGILVGMVGRGASLDSELVPRNGQVDSDVEQVTLPMVTVWRFDCYATVDDLGTEPFEAARKLSNPRVERRGRIHVAIGYLQRKLHLTLSVEADIDCTNIVSQTGGFQNTEKYIGRVRGGSAEVVDAGSS
jgi:hypothetical protein